MTSRGLHPFVCLLLAGALAKFATGQASAQATTPPAPAGAVATPAEPSGEAYAGGSQAARLLGTPVSRLIPGDVPVRPKVSNPVAGSKEAGQRGMRYFVSFNCVGCHADNGGGGMGPALSNRTFIYGGEPANVYLSIYQGRPNGMPAWGAALPDSVIWDLVEYISGISKEPETEWGKTFSADTMKVEQVPAEFLQSATPWSATQSFSHGQKPNRAR